MTEYIQIDGNDLFSFMDIWIEEWKNWEGYDFPTQQWLPIEKSYFHWVNPYPYPVSFYESMKECTRNFLEDVKVYYYESNESFKVVRKKTYV